MICIAREKKQPARLFVSLKINSYHSRCCSTQIVTFKYKDTRQEVVKYQILVNLQCSTRVRFALGISGVLAFVCGCACSIRVWLDRFGGVGRFGVVGGESSDSFASLAAAVACVVCVHLLWKAKHGRIQKAKLGTDLFCLNLS